MQILSRKIKNSLIFYKCSFTGKNEKILKLFSKKITNDILKVYISTCENDLKIAVKKCFRESNLNFIIGKNEESVQNTVIDFAKNNVKKIETKFLKTENFKTQRIIVESSIFFLLPEETKFLRESLENFVAPFILRDFIIKGKMLGKDKFKILKHKSKVTI